MTLDDLHRTYCAAWLNDTANRGTSDGAIRAGIAAVVRALRGEICVIYEDEEPTFTAREIQTMFNEILDGTPPSLHAECVPDEGGAAAESANTVDGTRCPDDHAPAAVPRECVWGPARGKDGKRQRGCNKNWVLATHEYGVREGDWCVACGKPIRFEVTP